jgi:hypothetical protein
MAWLANPSSSPFSWQHAYASSPYDLYFPLFKRHKPAPQTIFHIVHHSDLPPGRPASAVQLIPATLLSLSPLNNASHISHALHILDDKAVIFVGRCMPIIMCLTTAIYWYIRFHLVLFGVFFCLANPNLNLTNLTVFHTLVAAVVSAQCDHLTPYLVAKHQPFFSTTHSLFMDLKLSGLDSLMSR